MSHHPDRLFPAMGQFDPSYALYEDSFRQPLPPRSEPPTHFDGVQFWYRTEPQEPIYEHNGLLYNPGLTMASSPLDQPLSVKHRRTRSGCFTCRHRRVKCDETRPICERCRKGNRECHFPQPSSSSRRMDASDLRGSQGKISTSENKTESSRKLPLVDEDESEDEKEESISPVSGPSQQSIGAARTAVSRSSDSKRRLWSQSDTAEVKEEPTSPRSIDTEGQRSVVKTPVPPSDTPPADLSQLSAPPSRWQHLDSTTQKYLQYHHEHISYYHYFLRDDPENFIHDELLDIALSFEPLMHAIVGFAAYHHTLNKPDGRFQEFWKYYCQSIMLLRKWLESHTERHEAALLTILQLATFEEYLGDWASVASHQRAAYSIFNALFTHENVMATMVSRCIFNWLARADIALSLMSGARTVLERKWFVTELDWHKSRIPSGGLSSASALPYFVAKIHLLSADMATVFSSQDPSSTTTDEDVQKISKRMESLRAEIQEFYDLTKPAPTSSRSRERIGSDQTGYESQVFIFDDKLFGLNFIWVDWYASEQMRRYQTALFNAARQSKKSSHNLSTGNMTSPPSQSVQTLPPELEKISLLHRQYFEAIEMSSNAPPGAVISCQSALALASVFFKKDSQHTMWARRKLAEIERMGYVWPPSFRKRMSQLWNDKDILDWWLPNTEHRNGLLREIREVVEERNKEIEDRGGDEKDDVREIKAVFDKLDFGKKVTRRRKDSVWSATGMSGGKGEKTSDPIDLDPDGGEDDHDGQEELEVFVVDKEIRSPKESFDWSHRRQESRDSGVGSNSASTTSSSSNAKRRSQPAVLEYSNRMSGIWEGPMYSSSNNNRDGGNSHSHSVGGGGSSSSSK